MCRLGRKPMVPLVEQVADEPAQEAAANEAGRDSRAPGARGTRDQAAHRGAAKGADRGLRVFAHLRAAGERHDRQHSNRDHSEY